MGEYLIDDQDRRPNAFLGHALLESQLSSFDFSIMSGTQVNGGNGDGGAPNPEEQCKKDEHYYFELVVFKV